MIADIVALPPGIEASVIWWLAAASFIASFITVALGIGGGALLLAIMANFLPPIALIPVHGVVQLGSNATRATLLLRHVQWQALAGFTIGSVVGAGLGGLVVVELPANTVQIGVGLFVIWSVFGKPPSWFSRWPALTGASSSFLTMFFGATGVFVATYTKSLDLNRFAHVATHAVLMTVQHLLKIAVFGLLGFAFAPWLTLIVVLIFSGMAGTLAGRAMLGRLSDLNFKRALDVLLILISLRLIWIGLF